MPTFLRSDIQYINQLFKGVTNKSWRDPEQCEINETLAGWLIVSLKFRRSVTDWKSKPCLAQVVLRFLSGQNAPTLYNKWNPSMTPTLRAALFTLLLFLPFASALADDYSATKKMFQDAGASNIFNSAYGYALFPTIGKAGYVIGGAYGKGRVYEQGEHTGDTSMIQVSIGFQLGGSAFSQVIFFQDKRALDQFTSGNFEFGAEAQAVALTAAAGASANTSGSSTTASGGMNNAITAGDYYKGMATFNITKGGLMYEASIGGQKFSYTPR